MMKFNNQKLYENIYSIFENQQNNMNNFKKWSRVRIFLYGKLYFILNSYNTSIKNIIKPQNEN